MKKIWTKEGYLPQIKKQIIKNKIDLPIRHQLLAYKKLSRRK
jgi:hypothetical protein